MKSFLDRLKAEYLPKSGGARFTGMPVADMSRDELIALVCWFIDREVAKVVITNVEHTDSKVVTNGTK